MIKITYKSKIAKSMAEFINFKQQSGYDYEGQAIHLRYFDKFLCSNGIIEEILTAEIVGSYISSLKNHAPNTRKNRLGVLKQFSEYLQLFYKDSYVILKNPFRSQPVKKAYVYSRQEVSAILETIKAYHSANSILNLSYYTLTGLLIFTGIRIRECLELRLKDWDYKNLTLFVRKGKFGKDRLLPVKQSVAEKLEKYIEHRLTYGLTTPNDPIFINSQRRRITYCCFRETFSKVLTRCGIDGSSHPFSRKPSIHALRHSFAVWNIEERVRDGKDVNSFLPYVATYMGHVGIESTQIYLQATEELIKKSAINFLQTFNKNTQIKGEKYE